MTSRVYHPCACCNALYEGDADASSSGAYCDRCEVAYLEFKLALLVAVYRGTAKKADEV